MNSKSGRTPQPKDHEVVEVITKYYSGEYFDGVVYEVGPESNGLIVVSTEHDGTLIVEIDFESGEITDSDWE